MSVKVRLRRWQSTGAITGVQHDAITALVRKDRWSVFVELNLLLYLGVLSFAAGVGWTVTTYSERLGDLAILSALTAVFAWALYYCFSRSLPYSNHHAEPPGLAFDYVLYLGCLVFSVELGYMESRFHPFGADWDHSLLLASAVFFALAYRFDNRLVLSLALSSLGAWFGVRVSHFGRLLGGSLREYALTYGVLVAAGGTALHRAGIKKHFLETYLHVGATVLFIALVSGTGDTRWLLYLTALLGLAAFAIVEGVRFTRFAFVVYGVGYAYAGMSARLAREFKSPTAALTCFVVSGTMVVIALVVLARRFGRDA
jgi:hypothetical protein